MTLRSADGTVAAVAEGPRAVVVRDGDGGPAFPDAGELLRAGGRGLRLARRAVAVGEWREYGERAVAAPVSRTAGVFCVGLNYAQHIREMGRPLPSHPTYFSKLARALTGPYDPVELPADAYTQLDYEGELAVVIGVPGRNIRRDDAWRHVGGFCVMNDVSMRDLQRRSTQWFVGKTWQRATPVGPFIVTPEEVGDIGDLELTTRVNGQERQRASISDLLFDVPALIADLSRIVELEAGDMIATGTPSGVGDGMEPKRHIRPGDEVEVAVARVGSVRTTFSLAEDS